MTKFNTFIQNYNIIQKLKLDIKDIEERINTIQNMKTSSNVEHNLNKTGLRDRLDIKLKRMQEEKDRILLNSLTLRTLYKLKLL